MDKENPQNLNLKENPQNLNVKENPGKLKLKKLFVTFLFHNTFTFLGALLFIYLEECRPEQVPKPSKSKELQQFQMFINSDMNLTFNEKYIILNKTNALLMGERKLDCAINELNILRWWRFTVVTVYTIGYGFVTPKTDIGKIAVMIYASVGIPFTIAYYSLIADIITILIARLIRKLERKLLKRRQVHHLEIKVFLMSCLFNTVFLHVPCALMSTLATPKLSYIDSMYFMFQTITTIGYGDIYPHFSDQRSVKSYVIIGIVDALSLLGLALVAAVIAAMVKYLEALKAKKLQAVLSSLTKRNKNSDYRTEIINWLPLGALKASSLGEKSADNPNPENSHF